MAAALLLRYGAELVQVEAVSASALLPLLEATRTTWSLLFRLHPSMGSVEAGGVRGRFTVVGTRGRADADLLSGGYLLRTSVSRLALVHFGFCFSVDLTSSG